MKKYLTLFAILTCLAVPGRAAVTANLDGGELTGNGGASMPFDNTAPSSNGSLLLLIDLGSSNTIDNSLNPGSYVSGTNFVLAAAGFNTDGGTNETLSSFNITSGTTGDDIALRWFPSLTFSQYNSSFPSAASYFGTYAPNPLGSTPDGGSAWTLPSSGTIDLKFFTSNSGGGGSQPASAGYANFQVSGSVVPEPSTYALFGMGALVLFWAARRKKTA